MAEYYPAHISNLFLGEGIPIPYFSVAVSFVYIGGSVALPLLVVGFLFWCCKNFVNYHVKRCPHCTNPRSFRARCKNSSIRWIMKFCSIFERFTAWLLVDLFRTPKVEKVLIKDQLRLKVLNQPVQTTICVNLWTFLWISFLFGLYIAKLILDIFLNITPTCISEGDFGFPAICYAGLHVSEIYFQVNCTTWNENYKILQEVTGLFCVSLFYQFLTSLAQLAGLYSLQFTIIQIKLSILGKICKCKRCRPFFLLTGSIFLILIMLPMFLAGNKTGNTKLYKLYRDIILQQFPILYILIGSFILSFQLLVSINHNTNLHSRFNGAISMRSVTRDRQRDYVTEKRVDEQIARETDIFVTEEGRSTWCQSQDERHFETAQREDITSVEIHDYTPEEACTTGEHNEEGILEGYGHIQMEYMEAVV